MHHIIEGKPRVRLQAGSGIGNIPGFPGPFANNFNDNGINGHLRLTILSGAINNSLLFGLPSTTGLEGLQGLELGVGSSSLTPGVGLNVPGIINGQLNPQPTLQGDSGVPHDNVIVTVIEDTLTEGPDLHSSDHVLGKREGYYYHIHMPTTGVEVEYEDEYHNAVLITFTAKFEGSEYVGNNIEFAGKDKASFLQREIAVVGGTVLFHDSHGHDVIKICFHTEVETLLKFTVNLTY
ncbi:hypothetical protein KI387_032752 [Taxus chinensis]|uniref:Dirigent protein n=1 Tax=Taxus chinensis TaxID=29808 RepID=A0AA38BQ44_TAXCH|nr:hypothetical protein KI387_032752 [Taxus chinensis]